MKNPYSKLPGYVASSNEHPNGWIVVFDRSKIEQYTPENAKFRWLAKHMETGKTKVYRTKDEAKFEAYRTARSIHAHDHWWLND